MPTTAYSDYYIIIFAEMYPYILLVPSSLLIMINA